MVEGQEPEPVYQERRVLPSNILGPDFENFKEQILNKPNRFAGGPKTIEILDEGIPGSKKMQSSNRVASYRQENEQVATRNHNFHNQFGSTGYKQNPDSGKQIPTSPFPSLIERQAQFSNTQCPHCGRKFSEKAALRHIPVCPQKG